MHLISFLRGAAFGGLLVYLFAPRSGAETRRLLAQRGNNLKQMLSDEVEGFTSETSSAPVISSGNIYDPATLREVE